MQWLLELIDAALFVSNSRTETIDGDEFVIAEATILREGVLNGNEGPLFYSEAEISRRVGAWNGIPLVAPHPYIVENGKVKHVSAGHSHEIVNKFTIGRTYNDRIETQPDGKKLRKVDIYINVKRSDQIDTRIVPAIKNKQQVNVSTGIFTEKRKAVDNSRYNGTGYTHSVHNIEPDHLAVLMDEKGACSVSDGCGVNINSSEWELDGFTDSLHTNDQGGIHPSESKDPNVLNAWTSAARQASLQARRSSGTALLKDKKARNGNRIRSYADRAVSHHAAGEFRKARLSHKAAAKAHRFAGVRAKKRGDHKSVSAHSDAVASHRFASKHYARNSSSKSVSLNDTTIEGVYSAPIDPKVQLVSNSEDSVNEKKELVSWLTTNCGCWRAAGSDTVLNGFEIDRLKLLKNNALKATFTDVATGIVQKVGKQVGFDPKNVQGGYNNLPEFVANAVNSNGGNNGDNNTGGSGTGDGNGNASGNDILDYLTPVNNGGRNKPAAPVVNSNVSNVEQVQNAVRDVFKNMTEDQWKEWAPAPIREVLNTAEKMQTERKVAIINALTSNIADVEHRKTEILNLRKKKLPELEEIAKYAGVQRNGTGTNNQSSGNNESNDERFLREFFNLGKGNSGQGTNNTGASGNGTNNSNGNNQQDEGLVRIGNLVMNTKDVLAPNIEDAFEDE